MRFDGSTHFGEMLSWRPLHFRCHALSISHCRAIPLKALSSRIHFRRQWKTQCQKDNAYLRESREKDNLYTDKLKEKDTLSIRETKNKSDSTVKTSDYRDDPVVETSNDKDISLLVHTDPFGMIQISSLFYGAMTISAIFLGKTAGCKSTFNTMSVLQVYVFGMS